VIAILRSGLGWKRRRGYGALLIHIGLAIIIVGIAGSWAYKTSIEGELTAGKSLLLGGTELTFSRIETEQASNRQVTSAVLALTRGGEQDGQLVPSLDYYPDSNQTWTRVARRSSLGGDIYVTLLAADPAANTVNVRMEVHPLIIWLWIGGGVMAAGGLAALVLGRRPVGAKEAARSIVAPVAAPATPGIRSMRKAGAATAARERPPSTAKSGVRAGPKKRVPKS
jgi:cytochrome c-type biogenesis protein CcmF